MVSKGEFHNYCKGKRIVILGNSKILLKEKKGEFVDNHDIVLRMNMGYPETRYQEFIGKRTDVWSAAMHSRRVQEYYHYCFIDRKYTLWPWYDKSRMVEELKDNVYCFSKEHYQTVSKECGSILSSGCNILAYFIRNIKYKTLVIMGFDFFQTPNFNRMRIVKAQHESDKEEIFITNLVNSVSNVEWIK